ncbi:hypothetical protein PRIPAC_71570, partial [Pristionchus pacificus]|uniref:G protein-coupled receptor n=1 Tax=Pristionchus pacificus TaxID=54126 RepID=A0A2A6CSZ6_PRIPA
VEMSYTGWNWTQIEQCLGRSEVKLSDRLFVGLPFLIFSIISVALNVIFMRIIHANRSTLDANLKRHVYSLAIACTGYMSVNFWSHIPIVLFAADIRDPLNIILATPNSFFYQAILFTNFFIAFDRFVMFAFNKTHKEILRSPVLRYIFVLIPWAMCTFIVAHSTSLGCYKRVNPYVLSYTYACSTCDFYEPLLYYFAWVFPGAIIFCYTSILLVVFRKRPSAGHGMPLRVVGKQRKELKLIVQFLMIGSFQLFNSAFFYVGPKVIPIKDVSSFLITLFSATNSITNPLVMIIFQERIRQSFFVGAKSCFISIPKSSRETIQNFSLAAPSQHIPRKITYLDLHLRCTCGPTIDNMICIITLPSLFAVPLLADCEPGQTDKSVIGSVRGIMTRLLCLFFSIFIESLAYNASSPFDPEFSRNVMFPLTAAAYAPDPTDCLATVSNNSTESSDDQETSSPYRKIYTSDDVIFRKKGCPSCHFGQVTSDILVIFQLLSGILARCDKLHDTCAGFAASLPDRNAVVISFRGTQGTEQLMAEIAELVTERPVPIPSGGAVGPYFKNAFDSVWIGGLQNAMLTLAAENEGKELWITGHSLGGSMASIAAATIVDQELWPRKKIRLMTYGEPRTGNKDYASVMDSNILAMHRVVHERDMVVHVPPPVLGYEHSRQEIFYGEDMSNIYSYVPCTGDEDPKCSNNLFDMSVEDHLHYYGLEVGDWGKQGCTGTTKKTQASILLCFVALLACSLVSAQYIGYASAYLPYYGYPAYGYGRYAGYGWGYPGYAAWWGSNKGGKGLEGAGPVGPSGLTRNQ